ncbi:hypothetical protein LIER_00767 [Lithospermum erythrorhizon]|uniref:Retrotransposon gag domain-containing protein n=1 Tax=Lithospermum erythrorhizon TaxID=34254 RepID=A0AAV3NIK3_LITER
MNNTNVSIHDSQQNNSPNEQPHHPYPADIEVEIQRRVAKQLARERDRIVLSSRYTHHTGQGESEESSEVPHRTRDNHERRSNTPAAPSQLPATQVDPVTQRLQQELVDIKEMMKALIPTATQRKECKTKMPFTDRLNAIPLPKGFILPQFTQFNGTGDPIKHLQGFLAKMTITSNDPDIYAKVFSNSLADCALDWYMALPLKSIDSYQKTADAFVAKFRSAIQKHQAERALMDIQQGPTETLRSYQKRYNYILLTIPEVNSKVVYMAFYRELAYEKLKTSLVLETPLSKDELTERVRHYEDGNR